MKSENGARRLDKRACAFACALGAILFASLCAAALANVLVEETLPEYVQPFMSWLPGNVPACIAISAVAAAVLGIGLYMLFTRFERIDSSLERMKPQRLKRLLPLEFSTRDACKAGAVILVLWAPIIAIMFPTGLTADTFNQLYQFQTSAPTFYPTTGEVVDAEFIDHHPVFDTLLYGAFWQLGSAMGSQDAGVFLLAVLQSVVLAGELGVSVCYLARLRVPYVLRFAALVFFAWFPFFAHYACTVLKDTTYLTFFVPWMIMWAEACRTRGKSFESLRFLVAFMALGGFCVLAKKLGVFVLVACLAVLVAVMRGKRLRLACSGLATLAVFCLLLPAAVFPAIGGVAPGGKQEAFGPAIQQVTALLHDDPNALSADERATCKKVFNVKRAVADYTPFRSDAAKSTFNSTASNEDIAAFLQVWLSEGVKHPDVYLASTFQTTGMLYIPYLKLTYYSGDDLASRGDNYAERNADFAVAVSQPEGLVELNDYLEFDSVESKVSDLPVVSLFFTEGFYGGWIPLIAVGAVLFAGRRRVDENDKPRWLTGLVPIIVSVAFLLVSPVASPRYILPLLFTTPLQLGWAWSALRARAKRSKGLNRHR